MRRQQQCPRRIARHALQNHQRAADLPAAVPQRLFLFAQALLRVRQLALQTGQEGFAVLGRARGADGAIAQVGDFIGKRLGLA